jgi:shikimate kinase
MLVVLCGISCVGKTTVGKILAARLGWEFADFDAEVSKRMGTSISRLKGSCFNAHRYYNAIKEDIAYFYSTLRKADIQFHIGGASANAVAEQLAELIREKQKQL